MSIACDGLLESTIERILFGTGPCEPITGTSSNTGALVSKASGTIFLEEIGNLSIALQTRLLRVLDEKRLCAPGTFASYPITARIMASSTCDLMEKVQSGHFRKDLFLRLNVVNLRLPPLRERKVDIPLITASILERVASESKREYKLGKSAIRPLMEYDWPGNVRELEHAIEYACVVSSGAELHLCDFPKYIQDQHHIDKTAPPTLQAPSRDVVDHTGEEKGFTDGGVLPMSEIEKQAILNTLRQLKGDKLLTAKLLGIGKTTLYRKLKGYGLDVDAQ